MQPTHAPLRTVISDSGRFTFHWSWPVTLPMRSRLPVGWLPVGQFASGNYAAWSSETISIYPLPQFVGAILFAGVLVWEAAAAGLFWRAVCWPTGPQATARTDTAWTVSIAAL